MCQSSLKWWLMPRGLVLPTNFSIDIKSFYEILMPNNEQWVHWSDESILFFRFQRTENFQIDEEHAGLKDVVTSILLRPWTTQFSTLFHTFGNCLIMNSSGASKEIGTIVNANLCHFLLVTWFRYHIKMVQYCSNHLWDNIKLSWLPENIRQLWKWNNCKISFVPL